MSTNTGFDPADPAIQQCPHQALADLRRREPVAYLPEQDLYLVTRYEDCAEVIRDTSTWSSSFDRPGMPLSPENQERLDAVAADNYPRVATMLTSDPPEHTRFRKLVSKAFTPLVVADLEPEVRDTCAELIDAWREGDRIEFVRAFAIPVPVRTIASALNVPAERMDDFKRWSDATVAGIGTSLSIEDRIQAELTINEMHDWFVDEIDRRRAEPHEDLLTGLLQARIDDNDDDDGFDNARPLDVPELLSIIRQLLVAGNETTTNLLAYIARRLAEEPDLWALVRDHPDRIPDFVEEALRLAAPVQGMFRIARRDVELSGVAIPAGARVVVMFGSANRDEARWPDGDSFDPGRDDVRRHLSFGWGIHYCLGAALARLEARVALEELTSRLGGLALVDGAELRYHRSFMLRGLERLDLVITGGR